MLVRSLFYFIERWQRNGVQIQNVECVSLVTMELPSTWRISMFPIIIAWSTTASADSRLKKRYEDTFPRLTIRRKCMCAPSAPRTQQLGLIACNVMLNVVAAESNNMFSNTVKMEHINFHYTKMDVKPMMMTTTTTTTIQFTLKNRLSWFVQKESVKLYILCQRVVTYIESVPARVGSCLRIVRTLSNKVPSAFTKFCFAHFKSWIHARI